MDQSKTILTTIVGILCYLIFSRSIELFTRLFSWIDLKFEIDRVSHLILTCLIIGFLSIGLLLFLYNSYLKNGNIKIHYLYQLIPIIIILTIGIIGIEKGYNDYLNNISPRRSDIPNVEFRVKFSNIILSIIGLILFLRKTKNK
jgi:vacuolar-type H+-ATPase subunit I/STV1